MHFYQRDGRLHSGFLPDPMRAENHATWSFLFFFFPTFRLIDTHHKPYLQCRGTRVGVLTKSIRAGWPRDLGVRHSGVALLALGWRSGRF